MVQVKAIFQALCSLGHDPVIIPFSLNLETTIDLLQGADPDLVFNLVETVNGSGRFVHLAPTILDYLNLPYTGSKTEALFLTSNKLLAKKILFPLAVPTPGWISLESSPEEWAAMAADAEAAAAGTRYIIKSVWEHASIGLDEGSVIAADTHTADMMHVRPFLHHLRHTMQRRRERDHQDCFAEIYIEGREFNLSLLAGERGEPEVLPPAEIIFEDYPAGKLKIVDYRAKWEEESFEYHHTPRRFDFPEEDRPLLKQLTDLSRRCWEIFELSGYARVDFRVDQAGTPWVLEINANPCISPDSGFAAAAEQAGLSFDQVIQRIIRAASRQLR
jgi:D-alanine-D-alanine ligase